MKAIILSAGQGKRLLPLTESTPKCLLPLSDHNGADQITILNWQLSQLEAAGVTECLIVTGFQAHKVEEHIEEHMASHKGKMHIRTVFNPFYKVADNLSSVWLAREFMTEDFILLNGDTLFTAPIAKRLIAQSNAPITLTVAIKDNYDDDDMKVCIKDGNIQNVSKKLPLEIVNGESIGMMMFRNEGIEKFILACDHAIKQEDGMKVFYLSVIDTLAANVQIGTAIAEQDQWGEVDFPADHSAACQKISNWIEAGLQSIRKAS